MQRVPRATTSGSKCSPEVVESQVVPPPWGLRGRGYVILLAPGARRRGARGEPAGVRPCGGFGVLMVMDYRRSEVGSYRELLYIPGRISLRTSERGSTAVRTVRGYSISRIYVTSETSRAGGIANWGIPKERGRITWTTAGASSESILVAGESGLPLLGIDITRGGSVLSRFRNRRSLPVSDLFLPHTLVQVLGRVVYRTSIRARGRARLAGRVTLRSYASETEELAGRRVLLAFHLPRFSLRFPAAVRLSLATPAAG